MKLLRYTAAIAALALTATPAFAAPVGPNQNATATARIVKPLTLTWVQDLNLGTILLSGAGTWTANVGVSRTGVFSCPSSNVVCSGATQEAKYKVTGTNNQSVTVSAPDVTLTNANDATKTLLLAVDRPVGNTVALGNSGNSGLTFGLGGTITVANDTVDGVYSGTFNVTVDY
jgi:hypothetical protein